MQIVLLLYFIKLVMSCFLVIWISGNVANWIFFMQKSGLSFSHFFCSPWVKLLTALQVKQDQRFSLKSLDQICTDWRSHSVLFLVDVLVDWQEHFLAPWEISSSCSIYLSSTSGLQKHRELTHPVYYRAAVPVPAGGASDIVHTMYTAFVSLVVKDNFWLPIIFLLLKVASVFNMLINAGFMCSPANDIWELLGIHHNSNDMFAVRWGCVSGCVFGVRWYVQY